jgi:hypothetical protein
MLQPMTVKELIKALLEFDMSGPVYIGLGRLNIPTNCIKVSDAKEFDTDIHNESGVYFPGIYLIPSKPIDIKE